MKRRELLSRGVASAIGFILAPSPRGAEGQSKKRILFFTKSSGFEHSVIRASGSQPSHAERVLMDLAQKHDWAVTHTKDGSVFATENLAQYDAFLFYTTGDLTIAGTDKSAPMTPDGKAAFLRAIKHGKGFIGTHSAADTFHSPGSRFAHARENADPYIQMLGGEFIQHGKQQNARMVCADPDFPGCADVKSGFELTEEWYSFKDYQKDLHVILVQQTDGMAKTGSDSVYNRPPYPATWTRMHGKGRVFYTSMGHREDVWTNPVFQTILAGGISWALGETNADVTPNVEKVAPGYTVVPPEK